MFSKLFWKRVGLEFARFFVATFVLGISGALDPLLSSGDYKAAGAALAGLVGGAVAAAIRAVQAQFTSLETDPEIKLLRSLRK